MTLISRNQDMVTSGCSPLLRRVSSDSGTCAFEATQEVISKQPGYVSASIHSSLGGPQVTNYGM